MLLLKIDYNNIGTTTNYDGEFQLNYLKNGKFTITVSYIGYSEKIIEVIITDGTVLLPSINLVSNNTSLSELEVIADIAKERVTPVAATTISAKYIEENLGNQEFPEILEIHHLFMLLKRVEVLEILELMSVDLSKII